jgi:hypothetical protein
MADDDKKDKKDDDEKEYVTKDELDAIVNKSVTAQFKRKTFREMIASTIGEAVTTAMKTKADDIDDDDEDDDDDDDVDTKAKGKGKSKADGVPSEVDKAIRKLQKENERLAKEVEKEKSAREEAADNARRQTERSKLAEQLQAEGIDKDAAPLALAYLYTETKRVKTNEDGKVVWLDDDGDEVGLSEGVKGWAESSQGKRFKPAREVAGSGNTGGKTETVKPDKDGEYSDADIGSMLANR